MARRKMRKSPRRKSSAFSVTNAAESLILASAALRATAGTNVVEFLTGRVNGKYGPGADGYATVTLPELLGFGASGFNASTIGGNYGTKTAKDALIYNLQNNGAAALGTLIVTPIAFRFGKKLLSKPINATNKALRMSGLGTTIKV